MNKSGGRMDGGGRLVIFTRLNQRYVADAARLANVAYQAERRAVGALPDQDVSATLPPAIKRIFACQHGVVALDRGQLVGYLSFLNPRMEHFGRVRGVYAPLFACAVAGDAREQLMVQLFQHASEALVAEGVLSYALTVYAHDHELLRSLVLAGFGVRCADAIRSLDVPLVIPGESSCNCSELPPDEFASILPLENALQRHLRRSPTYFPVPESSLATFIAERQQRPARIFVVHDQGELQGYLELTAEAETFISEQAGTLNICGAYLRSDARGRGLFPRLLAFVIERLRAEGVQRLGVDCETLNPTALYFWQKYFATYTYSLVRRLDERLIP